VPEIIFSVSFLTGFFCSPVIILGVEFACEVAYPVGEAYSNGMI